MANRAQTTPGAQLDALVVNIASLYGLSLGSSGTAILAPLVAICCNASACTARATPLGDGSSTLCADQPSQRPLLRSRRLRNLSRQLTRLDSRLNAREIRNVRSVDDCVQKRCDAGCFPVTQSDHFPFEESKRW